MHKVLNGGVLWILVTVMVGMITGEKFWFLSFWLVFWWIAFGIGTLSNFQKAGYLRSVRFFKGTKLLCKSFLYGPYAHRLFEAQ